MISLKQFVANEREIIAEFAKWWREQIRKDPEAFTSEMDGDDWSEAMANFVMVECIFDDDGYLLAIKDRESANG